MRKQDVTPEDTIDIKEPPILFKETQKLVREIARDLKGLLITYWNSPGGSVCGNDVIAMYQMLQKIGKKNEIYLFIKSDGGNGKASLRIVSLLRQYFKKIIALVPLECASAATMIAMGANEIRMGPMAYLTAVDTSITHDLSPLDRDNDRVSVSLNELNRVINLWQSEKDQRCTNPYQSLFQHVHPLVIGAADRAESLSIMLCKEILQHHITSEKEAESIARTLNSKYPSHTYPVLLKEARKVGLQVKPLTIKTNEKLLALNELYSEMGQRAITDYNETKYHNNEILNILETSDLQLFYQLDKDWYYRVEERRWVSMNDDSCWRKYEMIKNRIRKSRFHVV